MANSKSDLARHVNHLEMSESLVEEKMMRQLAQENEHLNEQGLGASTSSLQGNQIELEELQKGAKGPECHSGCTVWELLIRPC